MSTLVVRLPLPPRELSPNARIHWARKAPVTQRARYEAKVTAQAAGAGRGRHWNWLLSDWDRLAVSLHFVLPDRRGRDTDNLVAACKAYLDGIADALYCDDSNFDLAKPTREVRRGESAVEITIGDAP